LLGFLRFFGLFRLLALWGGLRGAKPGARASTTCQPSQR
jgi:hypothetical protein